MNKKGYANKEMLMGVRPENIQLVDRKRENKNEFHLFINNIETNLYNMVVYDDVFIKVLKPELHLLDKECMLKDELSNKKNLLDIESIKKFLNEQ